MQKKKKKKNFNLYVALYAKINSRKSFPELGKDFYAMSSALSLKEKC
jgi:hypothetical protein